MTLSNKKVLLAMKDWNRSILGENGARSAIVKVKEREREEVVEPIWGLDDAELTIINGA